MAGMRIEEGSRLARWAAYRARGERQQIAAAQIGDQRPWTFVENEVLVNARDRETIDLLERFGGVMLNPQPLPPKPDFGRLDWGHRLEGRHEVNLEDAPQTVTVRFDEPPRAEGIGPGREPDEDVTFSSDLAAAITAVVGGLRTEGRRVGLNVVGEPFTMPLAAPAEGAGLAYGTDPTAWPAFAGRSRVADAWQLVESVRQVRGGPAVWIALCDNGFWVDGAGAPGIGTGQTASDFGPGVLQWNLDAEGSPLPIVTNFHGNQVASAAVAAVGDGNGAAGSGGTIARPAFFHSARTAERAMRAVRLCVWWGLDVLNMSWGFWGQSEFWFDSDTWDDTFNWGADNGLVIVAAAGNSNWNLPDDQNVRPATRTPRTLTVGALAQDDTKAGFSNYGSSVNLWAPGTAIEVAPDGGALSGSRVNGTSFSAPIVAGVAGMMRYVHPTISADDVRDILVDSGWTGAGAVTKGLDAFAAVWTALGEALPDTAEPNNSPSTAAPLLPVGAGGALTPSSGGISALAGRQDQDYWTFEVTRLSTVTVSLEWYQRIANLRAAVEPVDEVAGSTDLLESRGSGLLTLGGLLPAGRYRLRVFGSGPTAYRLTVRLSEPSLGPDAFEPNDSAENATKLAFEAAPVSHAGIAGGLAGGISPVTRLLRTLGPGTFPLTLHPQASLLGWTFVNADWFEFNAPKRTIFRMPLIELSEADEPLDVTLYDEAMSVLGSWAGRHTLRIDPPTEKRCFLSITAARQTRYRLHVGLTVDRDALPGPFQEELQIGPKWWGDPPPLRLGDRVRHYAVDIAKPELEDGQLALALEDAGGWDVTLELLDANGELVSRAEPDGAVRRIDLGGVQAGTYVLRVNVSDVAHGADRDEVTAPARRVPALRFVPPTTLGQRNEI